MKKENTVTPQIPNPLYTYKPINTNTYHQILGGYLWASSPKMFNDTFDCVLNYQIIPMVIDMTIQQYPNIVREDMSDDEKRELMNEIINRQRIVSFTDKINNPTMWSHYGDRYKGICIGWNVENIQNKIHKVEYVKNPSEMVNKYIQNIKRQTDSERHSQFECIARLKLRTWEYESEYRYIDLDVESVVDKVPCSIKSITFGLETNDNEKDIIKHLVSTSKNIKTKIDLYQLRQDNKKLTLLRDLLPM